MNEHIIILAYKQKYLITVHWSINRNECIDIVNPHFVLIVIIMNENIIIELVEHCFFDQIVIIGLKYMHV